MKRVLIGLIALVVIAAGGWLGFNFYVQHRATSEVDAAFERIRTSGGKASHGKVAFDLGSRTLTIEDIALEPGQSSKTGVKISGIKIGSFKAAGLRQIDDAMFSANRIDLAGTEFAIEGAIGPASMKVAYTYKIPQVAMRDFSGPIRAHGSPASNSIIDLYRFYLEQFAKVTASSITVPTVEGTINADSAGAAISGTIAYSGLTGQNISQGKIDEIKADRAIFSFNPSQPHGPQKITGEVSNVVAEGHDVSAVAAMLDPQNANDDRFHTLYRHISAGPLVETVEGDGVTVHMRVGKLAGDDFALQPSKFQQILPLLTIDPSAKPTPAQAQQMLEKLIGVYEGVRVGKFELSDLSVDTPKGSGKLNSVRYEKDELAIEGLDTPAPEGQGRVKMERFALKSFSPAKLMHWSMQLAAVGSHRGQTPSPDQMLGVLQALNGIEIKGVAVPYKQTKKSVVLDAFGLNWGQFVGPIPTKVDLGIKAVVPADPSDPAQAKFIAAGIDQFGVNADLGAAWSEAPSSFVLAPVNLDLDKLVKMQTRIALASVPRGVFSTDPAQVMSQASQIEAGAIEFTLRDTGGVDLLVAEYAQTHEIDRDAARRAIIDDIRAQGETARNPDAAAAIDAVARFIETPGQTLVIKLTPLGKVPVMQLMAAMKDEPLAALNKFRIEASTGK